MLVLSPGYFATAVNQTGIQLAAHPNIVGTKLSHGIIDDQTLIAASPNIDHEKFSVFTGLGQNLLPVLAIGGVGTHSLSMCPI